MKAKGFIVWLRKHRSSERNGLKNPLAQIEAIPPDILHEE
jgi:hypothetical protein